MKKSIKKIKKQHNIINSEIEDQKYHIAIIDFLKLYEMAVIVIKYIINIKLQAGVQGLVTNDPSAIDPK